LSPDGRFVAYTLRETNWDDNLYKTEIWIADDQTGAIRQLTNSGPAKSASAPVWSPNSRRVAFSSDRSDKRQIYVIDPGGGEAEKLTSNDDGVNAFKWSPDGGSIAFTATEPQTQEFKDRQKKYGDFDAIDRDSRMTHLFLIDVASKKSRRLTQGQFTVGAFDWSPDGKQIAFDHRINNALSNQDTSDISVVNVESGDVRLLVSQPGPDRNPLWSPDGEKIAFESAMASSFSKP
jgi:Tol biopolymer transport system component